MNSLDIKFNPDLDKYNGIILFPSKHQSAVEMLIAIPLPDAAPLTAIEKITILLGEIEQTNKSIKYFEGLNDTVKLHECQSMKTSFVQLIQEIIEEDYSVSIFKKAA